MTEGDVTTRCRCSTDRVLHTTGQRPQHEQPSAVQISKHLQLAFIVRQIRFKYQNDKKTTKWEKKAENNNNNNKLIKSGEEEEEEKDDEKYV